MDLSNLSDDELFGKVEALAETERFCQADFLRHLVELDRRPACEKKGYGSLFAYMTRKLGFSESDAIRRVRAAKAAALYPSVLGMLARGDLHLVSLALLQPVMTLENHEKLLRRACRRSKREVEAMVAALLPPEKEPRERIRALPPLPGKNLHLEPESDCGEALPFSGLAPAPPRPLPAPPRVLFSFPADDEVRLWFKMAQDLLRHRFPSGRMEEIIGEALRRLVDEERPGGTKRRRSGGSSESRRIPLWVQDEVWRRDGGRCAYVGADGIRCCETAWLEFDHVQPWSLGGASDDPENIRLLCRGHNQAEARRLLGGSSN